jgi:hypothetical protein
MIRSRFLCAHFLRIEIVLSSSAHVTTWRRSIFAFGAHSGAHRVALRAGISIAVPLLTVWAIGHVEWTLYAAFGAFTALYGRKSSTVPRLAMQASAAVVMISSLLLGVVVASLPGSEWVVVGVAALWTMIVAAISDALKWHPPGPLFAVFALCAVASVPPTETSFRDALLVSGATAFFALLVGSIGHVRSERRAVAASETAARSSTAAPTSADGPAPVPVRSHLSETFSRPSEWLHLLRFGVAAAAAGSLSTALGIGHPYWAIVAAIVPIASVSVSHSFVRATHRVLGTVGGLVLACAILSFNPTGLVAILLVVALQVTAELFVGRNYGFALLFVTPLALVMIELAHHVPTATLITDRAVETLLGTVVALGVVLASWLVARASARNVPRTGATVA